MQFLIFILLYPLLWLVSKMPFRMLYIVSDIVYFIVYYLIRYRLEIVRTNISMALPNLTKEEQRKIERKSYRHLCDMFLEMVKTMTISEKEIKERFQFTNLDVYVDLEKKGKSIALLCAHYASYEWVISMNYYTSFRAYAIYKKVANVYFDNLVRKIRSRFKANLITTKETIPMIESNQAAGVLAVYGFASDQSPKASKIYHWAKFMGIESPVITGAEMLSKRFDMNVIFLNVEKIKRGYYRATFEHATENTKEIPNYQISEMFLASVEKQIYKAPEYYLWTHKRWKTQKTKGQTTS